MLYGMSALALFMCFANAKMFFFLFVFVLNFCFVFSNEGLLEFVRH